MNFTNFLRLDCVKGDIKLFKMVCFDPKLHFFENNRKNTELRIKSSLKLDRKVHILLLFTPKLALQLHWLMSYGIFTKFDLHMTFTPG